MSFIKRSTRTYPSAPPGRLVMITTRATLAAVAIVIGMTDYVYARPVDPFGGNTVEVPQERCRSCI
jgi:hypothetical protein